LAKDNDDEWSKVVKGDAGEEREKWLPRIWKFIPVWDSPRHPARIKQERLGRNFYKTACRGKWF